METKPSNLPKVFLKFRQQIVHFLVVPIFLFLFLILYRPFNLTELLTLRHGGYAFNCSMVMCIMFLVLLVSRLLLWGVRNVVDFKRRTYFLWCVSEVVVSSFFIAMYVTLMSGDSYVYIDVLPKVLTTLSGVIIFPYLIMSLLLESDVLARYNMEDPEDMSKIRFYDDKHNLKFVADSKTVLYIESHENYCSIFYTEGGRVKNFLLRGTMKRMEEDCSKFGILRCHRSYFVNVGRVKVLRKEREGYNVAELDIPGIESIPITPRYYQTIAERV